LFSINCFDQQLVPGAITFRLQTDSQADSENNR